MERFRSTTEGQCNIMPESEEYVEHVPRRGYLRGIHPRHHPRTKLQIRGNTVFKEELAYHKKLIAINVRKVIPDSFLMLCGYDGILVTIYPRTFPENGEIEEIIRRLRVSGFIIGPIRNYHNRKWCMNVQHRGKPGKIYNRIKYGVKPPKREKRKWKLTCAFGRYSCETWIVGHGLT